MRARTVQAALSASQSVASAPRVAHVLGTVSVLGLKKLRSKPTQFVETRDRGREAIPVLN
jgi:hypothetical protein